MTPLSPDNIVYENRYITFSELRPSTLLRDARLALKVSKVFPLPDWVKSEVVRYFLKYLEVTRSSVVVLEDGDGFFCLVPYRHRFLNINRVLEKFDDVFDRASKRFKVGVWLTLTTNPDMYSNDSYLEYRYKIVEALNRFLSWFRKSFGKVSYINAIEFTDSGLIHFHIIIFGLSRIEDAHKFMQRLRGWGFGYVHYMVSIVNDGAGWRPKVVRIENCDGGAIPRDVIIASRIGLKNYLKKYLMKTLRSIVALNSIFNASTLDGIHRVFQTSIQDGFSRSGLGSSKNGVLGSTTISDIWKLAFYWALRLRFFTCSHDILEGGRGIRLGRYSFVGVYLIERYIVYNNYYHDWLSYPDFLCLDVESIMELMF